MRIEFIEIRNFRRLKSIRIDFAPETTVFVGANNSGKTSAMTALRLFLVKKTSFTVNDFTLANWTRINKIGKDWESLTTPVDPMAFSVVDWEAVLPSLDLWLRVGNDEIHYVSNLLPSLDWEGGLLGVRLRLEPKNVEDLYKEYVSAIGKAKGTIESARKQLDAKVQGVALWPRTMVDFLERRMNTVLTVRPYVLDPAKQTLPDAGLASPQALPPTSEPIDADVLEGLIRIDSIHAQRDFADVNSTEDRFGGIEPGQRRRLSVQLRSYYDKHLNPLESPDPSDLSALQAIRESEKLFDANLKTRFSNALKEVESLGYPGVTDPKLTIATKMSLTDGLDHPAAVQYDVLSSDGAGSAPLRLPEDYNGLGYQNLISIVFKLMGFRDGWMRVGKAASAASAETKAYSPPPLHLVLIEEPEAHLHAQVQQVFIRKAYELLRKHADLGKSTKLSTQLVISTHSSHVAHESKFSSLRYFRRTPAQAPGDVPTASVINLSEVFGSASETERFVTRYLKAVHADLFFADAAIFVEGPAERILMPQFIVDFPQLNACYLTVLELGGSHAHRLRQLIEHLGLITLVITDIDATESPGGKSVIPARGQNQVTRNATLKTWHPEIESLDKLLSLTEDQKVRKYSEFFSVRMAYQYALQAKLSDDSSPFEALPNTFEDALVCGNLDVFRTVNGVGGIGKIRDAIDKAKTGADLAESLFDFLKYAKKAELALDLLELEQPVAGPLYIREGLRWLQDQLSRKAMEYSPSSNPTAPPEGAAA